MKFIFYLIFLPIVIILGFVFAINNSDDIILNYIIGSVTLPLSLVLVFAVMIGVFSGILVSLSLLLRARSEIMGLKKSSQTTQKELQNLRGLSVNDKYQELTRDKS